MAVGLAPAVANALLDALGNATNYTAPTAFWIQRHTADPGVAGTTAVAADDTRKQVSFGAASAGAVPDGSMANDADIVWDNVTDAEDYTHWTGWTTEPGGTFIASGVITANAVLAGDTFTIPTGDLVLSFNVAA